MSASPRSASGRGLRRSLTFLARDAAVYGLATALNRLVKIVLVPIVAKSYPADVYGAFDTLSVYLYVGAALAILGLNSSVIIVATSDGQASSAERLRDPATTCFRVILFASLVIALAVGGAATFFSQLLLGTSQFADSVRWAAASIPCTAVLLYCLSLLQWSFRKGWYVGLAFGTAVATIGLTFVSARYTSLGLSGFFVANLVGQGLGAVAGVLAARDMIVGRWEQRTLRPLLMIGLPFAVISVAGGLLPAIGRFFLVRFHSLVDAGYYGLGQKISALLTIMLAGFQAAWVPFAFARRGDPDARRLFSSVLLLVATMAAYLSVLLVLLSPWLAATAATADYRVATVYVGPLALTSGMAAVFAVVAIGSVFEGRSLHNLAAYVAGLAVTVGLNVLLAALDAPPVGIAWASLAGQVTAVLLMAVLSQQVHPIPYPFARSVLALVAGATAVTRLGGLAMALRPSQRALIALTTTLVTVAWIWVAVLDSSHRSRFAGSLQRALRRSS